MPSQDPQEKLRVLIEDLSALEDYVKDLFVFLPLPLAYISPKGIILESNPAFEEFSGLGFNEIIGEPLDRLFDPEDTKLVVEQTLREGQILGKELNFYPKGKESKVVQVFTRAREDEEGVIVGFFLSLFDLTKIKEAEEELRLTQRALLKALKESERAREIAEREQVKTRAIIANLGDGLLVFERSILTLINPSAELFLGVKKEDVIGKGIVELAEISPFNSLFKIVGKNIKKVFRATWEIKEDLVLEVSSGVFSVEGLEGRFIVLHDVSREKLIEKMKTEFVSIAAHQLRTPLSAIKWSLRMILDGDLGELSPEQKEYLERTYQSNERMIDLINSLLNVARIEEGRFVYTLQKIDISQVLKETIEELKSQIKSKKQKLKLKIAKGLPLVLTDPEKIKLVFQNLIENAVKYTPEKGSINIELKSSDKKVFFKIQDTGVGIPKKEQDRIFGKFFRGSNVIKMETQGNGLGLFIVKNIIEAHGGKIWFESEENKGTTFYFEIPIESRKLKTLAKTSWKINTWHAS